jgi:hypothetical protein
VKGWKVSIGRHLAGWRRTRGLTMKPKMAVLLFCSIIAMYILAGPMPCRAQLQVVVHIWGEVREPGEYHVPAGTNILELISKAGGPTEYANLGKVKVTHNSAGSERAFKVNLNRFLDKENYQAVLELQKGDVVRVSRNGWSRWRTAIRVVADVAIIANVYYWLTRE